MEKQKIQNKHKAVYFIYMMSFCYFVGEHVKEKSTSNNYYKKFNLKNILNFAIYKYFMPQFH